jgi:coenzyme F420 hydrogenase subunit beta
MKCNPLDQADFKDPVALTVGLFCTWALDYRTFVAFLSKRVDLSTIRSMDIPPPPADVLIVKTAGKDMEIPLNDIRPLIPKGCGLCPDMTAEWADVSVGAYEGKPGWNTLIIRSEKGEALVEEALGEGYLILDELPESSLAHLTEGAEGKQRRARENARKAEDKAADGNQQPAAAGNTKMSSFQ